MELERLYVGRAATGDEPKRAYLLVLKDDFSGFVRLVPADAPTAANVVAALCSWFADFGVVRAWASDQGSHFTAEVMEDVATAYGVDHRFHTAY